jgi:hypothetical protein
MIAKVDVSGSLRQFHLLVGMTGTAMADAELEAVVYGV